MALKDSVGNEVSGASAPALETLERGLHELRCYINDPVATVESALAASPQLTMGHVLKAYLHLLGTEPGALPVARAACQAGQALQATDRERRHLQAIKAFGDGNYAETVRLLRPVRSYAHRFGGSHAQRDVLDLTLIEAARRAGQENLAAALVAERRR